MLSGTSFRKKKQRCIIEMWFLLVLNRYDHICIIIYNARSRQMTACTQPGGFTPIIEEQPWTRSLSLCTEWTVDVSVKLGQIHFQTLRHHQDL
jgi:hypothetical protein